MGRCPTPEGVKEGEVPATIYYKLFEDNLCLPGNKKSVRSPGREKEGGGAASAAAMAAASTQSTEQGSTIKFSE